MLKQPLNNRDRFNLTLKFERAGTGTVNVPVQTLRGENRGAHRHKTLTFRLFYVSTGETPMKKPFKLLLAATGLIGAALLGACGGGDDAVVAPAPDKAVTITFAAFNGSHAGGLRYAAVRHGQHRRCRGCERPALLHHQPQAGERQGRSCRGQARCQQAWQLTQGGETVSLIDLENATGACSAANNTQPPTPSSPARCRPATYVGLKASMGVPETMNHSAVAGGVPPLDNAAMNWSWQTGRKFAKIELNPVGHPQAVAAKPERHQHSPRSTSIPGSTGCTPKLDAAGVAIPNTGTCTNLNVMDFSLAAFDASTQKVVLDIGQLFSTTDITRENGGAPGCMSGATDPECPTMFSQLQVSFGSGSTGLPINGGAAQKIFKAAAK
jgi:uncharacterized repeat protein (TIGR04052 family)